MGDITGVAPSGAVRSSRPGSTSPRYRLSSLQLRGRSRSGGHDASCAVDALLTVISSVAVILIEIFFAVSTASSRITPSSRHSSVMDVRDEDSPGGQRMDTYTSITDVYGGRR